jgi:hypothetical protein
LSFCEVLKWIPIGATGAKAGEKRPSRAAGKIFRADLGDEARRLVASSQPLLGERALSQTATVARWSMRSACTASHIDFGRFDETGKAVVFFTKVIDVTLRETSEAI